MLVSDDPSYVERARHLSTQARDPAPHYEHSEIGFNYRMSNLLAALGRAQVEGLPVLLPGEEPGRASDQLMLIQDAAVLVDLVES